MAKKQLILSILALVLSTNIMAQRYNTEKSNQIPAPNQKEISDSARRVDLPKNMPIPQEWIPYLNPAYEDFWSEGNHKPDAGFILFARNPTKENAKLWLIRMETKAKLLNDMYGNIQSVYADLIKNKIIEDRYGMVSKVISQNTATPSAAATTIKPTAENLKDTVVYFIFNPDCPHCATQAELLKPLKDNVIPLQVGGKDLKNHEGLKKSDWASQDTIKTYTSGAVPVTVVFNKKTNKAVPLTGVQQLQSILGEVVNVSF